MKNSQNGFALLTMLLIAAGVLVAGGAGYWWYQNQNQAPELIGGQTDEHGCLGPAGYSWCEVKQKCLRVWEEKCEATSTVKTADWKTYRSGANSAICIEIDTKEFGTVYIEGRGYVVNYPEDAKFQVADGGLCGGTTGVGIGDTIINDNVIIAGKKYSASGRYMSEGDLSYLVLRLNEKISVIYGATHYSSDWKSLGAFTDSEYQKALDSAKEIVSTIKTN